MDFKSFLKNVFDWKLIAKLLIVFGLICFAVAGYFIWERTNPNRLSFKDYNVSYKNSAVSNPPVRITIKDLKMDLPIIPAKVQNGIWETTTQGASYLVSSPIPGKTGNSIIYAHDWQSLFGPLHNIQRDMTIVIEYKDKSIKSFIVKGTAVVSNDQTSILEPSSDKRLTLYTCTGFLDSQRLVAIALYEEKNHPLTLSN
jgi:LPXTG-site transpeptidase (sortase) family protein